eukprot:comp50512_c0_seq1/m.47650 comp50512_c0_seq1/g.47650  ORF comp50512_c0_seq1/g.47650 comp50512_c0_seq1/m.47650 type:complete len:108 (+) comp50512_c0_seq1:1066-1389(+)
MGMLDEKPVTPKKISQRARKVAETPKPFAAGLNEAQEKMANTTKSVSIAGWGLFSCACSNTQENMKMKTQNEPKLSNEVHGYQQQKKQSAHWAASPFWKASASAPMV